MFGMELQALIVVLIIGAIAGWLATQVMGGGFGLIGDIILGIVGGFVAAYLFRGWAPFANWVANSIIMSAIGAIIVLFVVRLIKRA